MINQVPFLPDPVDGMKPKGPVPLQLIGDDEIGEHLSQDDAAQILIPPKVLGFIRQKVSALRSAHIASRLVDPHTLRVFIRKVLREKIKRSREAVMAQLKQIIIKKCGLIYMLQNYH